jgi:hypothetical protein
VWHAVYILSRCPSIPGCTGSYGLPSQPGGRKMLPNYCQLIWNTTILFILRTLNAAKYSSSCSDYFQKHSNKACQGLHSSRKNTRLRHCLPRQRQRLEQRLRIEQIVSPSDTRFPTRSAMTLLLCASWSMCAANSFIVNTVGFLCLLHSIVALW